jgi:hypothetical protein
MYVPFLNMAAILTQMNSDAVGTSALGGQSGRYRLWFDAPTGLAQGGNVINIYT